MNQELASVIGEVHGQIIIFLTFLGIPGPYLIDEVIEVRPLPLEELVAMARDGRLQDAKSAVGILRAAAFLEE